MSNPDELIAQFIEISGGEESVARFYLTSSNWSLEDALANFLGNQNSDDEANPVVEPPTVAVPELSSSHSRSGAAKRESGSSFKKATSTKQKFATLSDMSKRDKDRDSSSEEEGQAFYAGGSERSGQQVLGPPKAHKDFRDQLNEMFRMAREHSGDRDSAPGPSTSSGSVWGQGMRLGMTASDHSLVGAPKKKNDGKKPIVILKLWSQGFSIDNGELRLYNDPANKEFLETVTRGEIPVELLEMGYMVNVDVEDHRHEDFKRVAVPCFKGSGHTLGSPVPNIEGEMSSTSIRTLTAAALSAPVVSQSTAAAAAAAAAEVTNEVDHEQTAKEQLKLDTNAETTTLQIRLADGSRLTAHFNLTHTIADVQQYIRNARPQYAGSNFFLVSSFPTRELKDDKVTIGEANLKNAALMQRLL